MTSGLVTLGMILIIVSWIVQFYYSAIRKIFALSLKFVAIYTLGCIFLIIDAWNTASPWIAILNLVAAVVASLAGYFAKKARP
jgi:hypothetical protein